MWSQLEINFAFVKAEADLAMTFLRTAEIESQSPPDPEAVIVAIEKAKEALATIHRFALRFPFSDVEVEYLRQRSEMIERAINQIERPARL